MAAAAPARRALVWRGFWAANAARRCSRSWCARARLAFWLEGFELGCWEEGRAFVRVRAVVVRRMAVGMCIVGFWGMGLVGGRICAGVVRNESCEL